VSVAGVVPDTPAIRQTGPSEPSEIIGSRCTLDRQLMIPRDGPDMKRTAKAIALSVPVTIVTLLFAAGATRAATEDEVKALFGKFVAAQNAHDLKAVREILQDSPQFLWITRGTQYWGREAALKRFGEYYQGTWSLEPKLEEIKITELSPSVAQLVAPTVFRIAPSGQIAQPSLFLLNHIYVKTADGWKLASIFPISVP
jgi:ketosteroid isomerase-like protein